MKIFIHHIILGMMLLFVLAIQSALNKQISRLLLQPNNSVHWANLCTRKLFPVAAARVWNSLPDLVTSVPSVAVFRSRLKTHLFNISYPSPCDCTVPAQWRLVALDANRSCLLTYLLLLSSIIQSYWNKHLCPVRQQTRTVQYATILEEEKG